MNNEQPETKIIFASRFMQTATGVFNGNAFPGSLDKHATVCANRLALFLFNLERVKYALDTAYDDFSRQLISNSSDLCDAASNRRDLKFVVYSDGLEYHTALHFALYSLKSFLDVYSILMCRSINEKTKTTTFGSKNFEGKKISGGKFLSWINGTSPASYDKKDQLIETVARHSHQWITEAVNYRDTLAHYGDIKDMIDMRLPLDSTKKPIDLRLIEKPVLPGGEKLDRYLESIMCNLGLFLDETIQLLPNVNQELIERWDKCLAYSRERKEANKPSRNSTCPCGSGKKYKHCHGKLN